MAKKLSRRRKQAARGTNRAVTVALILAGVVLVGGLLYLVLRPTPTLSLASYCTQNPDRCPEIGEADAPVTMVEVSDFGCPHCTDFHNQTAEPLEEQYVDSGSLRWIALPYSLNNTTLPAAATAMCADEQGAYFEYASALFGIEPVELRLSPAGFQQAAETVGLDVDSFNSCVADGRYISLVNANRDAARAAQVTGTPTFFLNEEKVVGAQPLSVFSQVIETALLTQ
ncbi:MAG TPA: thioredoxin domain-containing protein [Promineifilum sp.]